MGSTSETSTSFSASPTGMPLQATSNTRAALKSCVASGNVESSAQSMISATAPLPTASMAIATSAASTANTAALACDSSSQCMSPSLTVRDFIPPRRGSEKDDMERVLSILNAATGATAGANKQDSEFDQELDQDTLFELYAQIGRHLQVSMRLDQAAVYYNRALKAKRSTIYDSKTALHQQILYADVLRDMANIHLHPENPDPHAIVKSLHCLQLCCEIRQFCFGPNHPAVGSALYKLASVYFRMNDPQTSLELLEDALVIALNDSKSEALMEVWKALAQVQEALGQNQDARSSWQEASRLGSILLQEANRTTLQ